jgi:hypothetical protein
MHSSKLSTFVIDCQNTDLEAAAQFWSAALRRDLKPTTDDRYRDLRCPPAQPLVMIQKVEHPSRIHLDIESADIPAEVERLTGLGAKEIERIRTWVVMEAPTGQRFCVVRPQRPEQEAPPYDRAAFAGWGGHYQGRVTTYLESAEHSDDTLFIEPMLGGRYARLQWFGSVGGKPRTGEMVFACGRAGYEMTWVDTFHTSPGIMFSRGAVRTDGIIAVTGEYQASDQTWRWRTELSPLLHMRAFNIAPDGTEDLAIEVEWRRQ